jgi:hypothetical protein
MKNPAHQQHLFVIRFSRPLISFYSHMKSLKSHLPFEGRVQKTDEEIALELQHEENAAYAAQQQQNFIVQGVEKFLLQALFPFFIYFIFINDVELPLLSYHSSTNHLTGLSQIAVPQQTPARSQPTHVYVIIVSQYRCSHIARPVTQQRPQA